MLTCKEEVMMLVEQSPVQSDECLPIQRISFYLT